MTIDALKLDGSINEKALCMDRRKAERDRSGGW